MSAEALLACLPRPPRFEWDWAALEALLGDLPEKMAKTPQNPAYHGEGDVWTHTRMVCEALASLTAFCALPDRRRDALALAAVLHDIGKIRRTRLEDGQWVSPGHGAIGALMARKLLWQGFDLAGTPDAQRFREAVCLYVRRHSAPMYMFANENTALRIASAGELAPDFTLRGLCLLAQADAMGRDAPDVDELLDAVACAEALAEEEGCLDGPYPFLSRRTRRALFSGGRVWKDQALYDSTWGEVVLMCGLPGTGKDTWIREHCPELPVVSLDALRAELGVRPDERQTPVVQAAKERAKAFLRKHQPFVWNATSLTRLRVEHIALFERYGARVRVVYLETGWAENLRRNANRPATVPVDVIENMLDDLEPPLIPEADAVEWWCV